MKDFGSGLPIEAENISMTFNLKNIEFNKIRNKYEELA